MHSLRYLAAGAVSAALAVAVQTRTWTQTDYSEFEKGARTKLSLRADGLLTLAPKFTERFDASTAYLWAVAGDSKGNLYTGGGPGAKLFRISPQGAKETLAELEGLQVQAIVVDRKDRVFAATSPDGKVYRVEGGGKPQVFYDPKAKYIWALALDSSGNLYVGTGDQGEIHRVTPDGKGAVFFRTDETHARSLAVDASGNVIAGTEPGGLVLRISPRGEAFVLYQIGKKEVTAVAVDAAGAVWAAGVGTKSAGPMMPPAGAAPAPAPTAASPGGMPAAARSPLPPPPSLAPAAASGISGGSEVWRIDPNSGPRKMWEEPQEIVYCLAFDAAGKPLLGTGNKGYVYRIDSSDLDTALLNAPPTQITAIYAAPGGRLFAATGNVGKIYEIGPGLEPEGSLESDVFDAALFTQWGRLTFDGEANGGHIAVSTRSGNLDRPHKNWSPWSPPITASDGARAASPPARFLQWKATLTASSAGQSPHLRRVEVAYLPNNVEPSVDLIEITPPNYRFPTPPTALVSPQTLNLPSIGKKRGASPPLALDESSSLTYAKGFLAARWSATDLNGDTLAFTVHIRGVAEREWKLLREKVRERSLSWDSSAYADGEYVLRVTASDQPSNPPDASLQGEAVSDPFLIDNSPPVIDALTASRQGGSLTATWNAGDALSNLKRAEYSLDGGEWMLVPPTAGLSDAHRLDYSLTLTGIAPGEHTLAVRVQDEYDNRSVRTAVVQ